MKVCEDMVTVDGKRFLFKRLRAIPVFNEMW